MSNPHLLIIGVGYVGKALQDQALAAGWAVTGVTQSGGEHGSHACDVRHLASVSALRATVAPSPSVIVFCASSGGGGVEAYRDVFLKGVEHLLTVYRSLPFIFVSSSSVYAQTNGETVDETSETNPSRETGHILLAAEKQVIEAGGIVARLAGIYGPKRSVLLRKLLTREAVVEEDGRRIINQIHRDDAASALLFLAQRFSQNAGQSFNVSDDMPRSQYDTYQGLCARLPCPFPPTGQRNLNKKRGWTHKAVSNQKLRKAGWVPRYPDFLEAAPAIADSLRGD